MPKRPRKVTFCVSPDEREMLRALAERAGLTTSGFLRAVIRREHAKSVMEVS